MSNLQQELQSKIDVTSMKTIYGHLRNNPAIDMAFLVEGDQKDLAEIGVIAVNGQVLDFTIALKYNRVKQFHPELEINQRLLPPDQAIACLYLPPFYFFIDLKKTYR